MRKTIYASITFVLFLGLAGWIHADDARAVIDKAIQASGGEEKLTKFKAETFKGKGTFHGMGVPIEYTGEWFVKPPGQLKVTIDIDAGGQKVTMVIVANKDKGWRKIGDNLLEMTEEQVANHQAEQWAEWVARLTPLKDKSFTLSSLGDLKINDRACAGIKVTHKGKPDVSLFIDKENHLLVKSESRVKDEGSGQEVNQETFYSDYKEAEGIKYSSKQTIKRDGKLYVEMEATEFKPLEKLEDDVFAKP